MWQTVNYRNQMISVGRGSVQERKMTTIYLTAATKLSETERHILFPEAGGAGAEKHGAAADIPLEVNKALGITRVLLHFKIQRLAYNKTGNLSRLIGTGATCNMLLPLHRELLLREARK